MTAADASAGPDEYGAAAAPEGRGHTAAAPGRGEPTAAALDAGGVDPDLEAFWADARIHANLTELAPCLGEQPLAAVRPPAWAFGGGPAQADALLALVLAGRKTATASALWDYEAEGEPIPTVGQLSIVLDGRGHPRALVRTDEVSVVPFDRVDAAHAAAEGEDDGSLASWRDVHQRFFTTFASHDRGFSEQMPVVLERFSVLYAPRGASPTGAAAHVDPAQD